MINIRTLKGWLGGGFALAAVFTAVLATPAEARRTEDMPRAEIKKIIVQEALKSPLPASLILAVAKVESDFQAQALSSKGARGVMQIMPETGIGEWGVEADELWDARLNVQLGIDFLERLVERYDGDWELALSYYNGGSAVGKPGRARVLPWTRKYVDAVLRWERRYATQNRIWLALVEREQETGVTGQIPRFGQEDDFKPVSTRSKSRRKVRSRVTWTNPARPRFREIRETKRPTRRLRRWRPNRDVKDTRRDDLNWGTFEQRLKAVRGTLDDFS